MTQMRALCAITMMSLGALVPAEGAPFEGLLRGPYPRVCVFGFACVCAWSTCWYISSAVQRGSGGRSLTRPLHRWDLRTLGFTVRFLSSLRNETICNLTCRCLRTEDAVAADLAEVPEDGASQARGHLAQHAVQRLCPVRRVDRSRLIRRRG